MYTGAWLSPLDLATTISRHENLAYGLVRSPRTLSIRSLAPCNGKRANRIVLCLLVARVMDFSDDHGNVGWIVGLTASRRNTPWDLVWISIDFLVPSVETSSGEISPKKFPTNHRAARWNFYDRASCAHRVRDYIRGSLEEREESAFLLKYRSPALTADREIHA